MTKTNYTTQDINQLYRVRHDRRAGIFGDLPYANYGYWTEPGLSIDDACNALTHLVATELGVNGQDEVLECGCGYGASAVYTGRVFAPQRIVGVDATEIRIQEGNKFIAQHGLEDRVEIRHGDATSLDFDDETFTKVMAIECSFHFNTRQKFLEEAFRVLKPGGRIAMTDIIPADHLDLDALSREQVRHYLSADVKYFCDANIYDRETYLGLLREAGFVNPDIYSIKDMVIPQFAAHLESCWDAADLSQYTEEELARKRAYIDSFMKDFMEGADYVVVRADKAA